MAGQLSRGKEGSVYSLSASPKVAPTFCVPARLRAAHSARFEGIYFDAPPGKYWRKGQILSHNGSKKALGCLTVMKQVFTLMHRREKYWRKGQILSDNGSKKALGWIDAVCTIRADGFKLPLLFISCGEPNGTIEKVELPTYPKGHVYTVQTKAWMDSRVWKLYLRSLLQQHITRSALLLVDNLECHVSGESEAIFSEELDAVLQPLPKNATFVCQP
ncbi:hypothetical protein PHMEG_00017212 [Phytophthora megakarya]|uniref:DDE-1 domain-containing protein n=1 Tax=Phytophthora megakarya TaxID=4795 RepID=A0A225VZG1_9STRA|nr:hypothetical protein PHMEG_00017212 [Phytophthora megakarya]